MSKAEAKQHLIELNAGELVNAPEKKLIDEIMAEDELTPELEDCKAEDAVFVSAPVVLPEKNTAKKATVTATKTQGYIPYWKNKKHH